MGTWTREIEYLNNDGYYGSSEKHKIVITYQETSGIYNIYKDNKHILIADEIDWAALNDAIKLINSMYD